MKVTLLGQVRDQWAAYLLIVTLHRQKERCEKHLLREIFHIQEHRRMRVLLRGSPINDVKDCDH